MTAAVQHWSASWPVLAGYLVLAGLHLTGLARLRSRTGTADVQERRREAALYQLGLLLVLLALVSPVGYQADRYIWVRVLQTLLIGVVGPGLVVLGGPWDALAAAWSGRPARRGTLPRWLVAHPVLMVVAANAVWLVWQVPALFDRAQSSAVLALIEHLSYLVAGAVFWLAMVSSRPFRQQAPALRRFALVAGTVAASTVYGMMLVFGSGVLYPVYANSAHHVMNVLDDQQLAGAVWWMGILPPMLVAAVALMMEWLKDEDSVDSPAELDRLLVPRRHGWPSRTAIR